MRMMTAVMICLTAVSIRGQLQGDAVLKLLRADPFAPGFAVHIRDLERIHRQHQDWTSRTQRQMRDVCVPLRDLREKHQQAVARHDVRCKGVDSETWNAGNCQASFDAIEKSKAEVDPQIKANNAVLARLSDEKDVLGEGDENIVQRGLDLLHADVGDQFRLYAEAMAQQVSSGKTTTCAAMADMYEALALHVNGEKFASILEQTLVGTDAVEIGADDGVPRLRRNAAPIAFPSTGFAGDYTRQGQNPVRHFTFYFTMSTRLGGSLIARATSYWLDEQADQPTDYAMTKRAIELAGRYGKGGSAVGNAIRVHLCN